MEDNRCVYCKRDQHEECLYDGETVDCECGCEYPNWKCDICRQDIIAPRGTCMDCSTRAIEIGLETLRQRKKVV